MTYQQINNRFSEVVSGYLSEGYRINTPTMMDRTQQELVRMDLTDGSSIVRVSLAAFDDGEAFGLEIVERKAPASAVRADCGRPLLRNESMTLLGEEHYWIVGESSDYFSARYSIFFPKSKEM